MKTINFITLFFALFIYSNSNAQCLNVTTTLVDVFCNGGMSGEIHVTPANGQSPYTYVLNGGSPIIALADTTINGLSAGTYTLVVDDNVGCDTTLIFTIIEPAALVATITSQTNVSCNGDSTGVASAIGSGGSLGCCYSYNWSFGQYPNGANTTATTVGLYAGTHTVTVTDANNCTVSNFVVITEPTALSVTIGGSVNVLCNGDATGNATAIVSGGTGSGYTVLWDAAAGFQTASTAIGLVAGSYCVTATDANGCTASTCVTITEPPVVTASITGISNVTCNGGNDGSITAMGSGGTPPYNYVWTQGAITPIIGVQAGSYCVTVMDNNGCLATPTPLCVTVTEPSAITVSFFGGQDVSCNGMADGTTTAVASGGAGGYTYLWYTVPSQSTATATGLPTGVYSVDVTDGNGCLEVGSITITEPSAMTVTAGPNVTESCIGSCDGTFNVSVTGGVFPVLFSIDGGVTFQGSSIFSNLCAGPYIVEVQNVNACIAHDTIMVLSPADSSVWPGDANNDNIANNFDLLPIGLHHGATGTTRTNASLNWNCQPSADWGTGINGTPSVDIKHADCDGNGTIENADTNAIILNWAQTHLKNNTNFNSGVDIYIDTATMNPGDTVSLPIILGTALTPTNGYGVAFTVSYDPLGIDSNSVSIDFSNSWLGNINSNMIGIYKDFYNTGEVEVALTRVDHLSATGGGAIGEIILTIKDDVLPKSSFIRLDFDVYNVRFIDSLGAVIPTTPQPSQILVVNVPTANSIIDNKSTDIIAYPNPTNGDLRIQSLNENIETIQVFDMMGNLVLESLKVEALQTIVDLNRIPSGMYVVNVQSATLNKNIKIIKR